MFVPRSATVAAIIIVVVVGLAATLAVAVDQVCQSNGAGCPSEVINCCYFQDATSYGANDCSGVRGNCPSAGTYKCRCGGSYTCEPTCGYVCSRFISLSLFWSVKLWASSCSRPR
jgi:hypothetical protein